MTTLTDRRLSDATSATAPAGRGGSAERRAAVARPLPVFEVTATDGAARAGVLHTAHGDVRTPVFMPVGTKATVKALDPDELRALGAQIVLGNTYHLHFRPGDELIAELGGLHRFMAWDGPILTDSGGFQVFSLRDTLLAVDDDGVTFRSRLRRQPRRASRRELAVAIQARSARDIAMCLDDRARRPAPRARARGGGRAHDALGAPAARRAARAPASSASAISAGRRRPPSCAARSIEELARARLRRLRDRRPLVGEERERDVRGDGLGGARCSRPSRPRYFMGIGDPEGILEVIERGVDMFDCVLPTRTARTGTALTWEGRLNLRNARFARDPRPLDDTAPARLHDVLAAPTSAIS